MKSSQSILILISAVSVMTIAAFEGPLCCNNGSIILDYPLEELTCKNGRGKPRIPCNISQIRFHDDGYIDDETKTLIVDSFMVDYPFYCIANTSTTVMSQEKIIDQVFLYCRDKASTIIETARIDLKTTIGALVFMISGIFLALTAIVYFFVPQTQDVEGRCTFHSTLNQSLSYLLGSYWALRLYSAEMAMVEFCISYWYLFIFTVLSFFMWSTVLAFHIRRQYRYNSRVDNSKLMHRYLIIAYGIPTVLVVICNITIYVYQYTSEIPDYLPSCFVHIRIMMAIFSVLPIIISQVISTFFFVSLQRKLWRARPENASANSISKLRKIKFRLLLNAKLFVLAGLPVMVIIICAFLSELTHYAKIFSYIALATYCFLACEGVIVFYMLVISRKRILQGIAGKFGVTVAGWQPVPESEESIAYENENENEPGREEPDREL